MADQSISSAPLADPIQAMAVVLDQFVLAKPGSALFTVFRNRISRLADKVEAFGGVLHLHWMPAACSDALISEFTGRALKTVWTLHDYRPLTGGCHYPADCLGYANGCKGCPQARTLASGTIARSLSRKTKSLTGSRITFASPSVGLFQAAQQSFVAREHDIKLIPNPVASVDLGSDLAGSVSDSKHYIFVAANVTEKRKGLDRVLAWWANEAQQGEKLLLVGQHSEKFASRDNGIVAAGSLAPAELANAYRGSKALVMASREDNAPGVLAEAALHGVPIICLDAQMKDWLASDGLQTYSVEQVRQLSSREAESLRQRYELFLAEREPRLVAQRYLELYFSE